MKSGEPVFLTGAAELRREFLFSLALVGLGLGLNVGWEEVVEFGFPGVYLKYPSSSARAQMKY